MGSDLCELLVPFTFRWRVRQHFPWSVN